MKGHLLLQKLVIALVIILTVVFTAVIPSIVEAPYKNEEGYFLSMDSRESAMIIGTVGQIIIATGGFVSLLISVKWFVESRSKASIDNERP